MNCYKKKLLLTKWTIDRMNNCTFFVEYEWGNGRNEVPMIFYEKGFCEKSNSGSVKFKITGILEYREKFYVILPKGMNVPERDKEKVYKTQLLMNTLKKYSTTKIFDDEESTWFGSINSTRLFEIVEWLIEDYRQNGLINSSRRKEQTNGNGRIEWTRTIQKKSPILINKKLNYLELITTKNDIVSDQELTFVHASILRIICESYGWLFNFNFTEYGNHTMYSEKYMLYSLKKAIKNTFIDREIRLFSNLISFLNKKSKSSAPKSVHILATAHFANIWEYTCGQYIGNVKELHKTVPKPYWIFEGIKSRTSQIPDILVEGIDHLVVFDAKYYRIKAGIDKLPGWGDIVKQLFYALSLKKISKSIYNAFLFPSSCMAGFKYLGYASVEGQEENFGKVVAYGIDITMVLETYVQQKSNKPNVQIVNNLFDDLTYRK